jgi:hydrogenase small subunit
MLSRREFVKMCMSSALTIGLTEVLGPIMREAYAQAKAVKPPVIWLELGSCTGNTISIEDGFNPTFDQVLRDIIDLRYHWTFNAAQGDQIVKTLYDTLQSDAGNFWLVVEGSVMTADNGQYNHVFLHNGVMVTGLAALQEIAPKAKHIIAVGDCACYGGPAAAHPNPGDAKGVWDVIKQPVINVPGCPAHADWMTGTFSHLALYGLPKLDAYNRPTMFFGRTIHELCERRQQFEDGVFAKFPGEEGCLYKVGCKGPITHADCPLRQWNHGINWPVKAGTPCIGCASPHFPDGMMPFYNHLPDIRTRAVKADVKKLSAALAAIGIGAVGTHLAAGVFARRIHKHYVDGTKPHETLPPENAAQLEQDMADLQRQQRILASEAKNMQQPKLKHRRKSWLGRFADFWRDKGKE